LDEVMVIGSLNMDLVVHVKRMPRLGETVRGSDLRLIPGGKGANQAAATALLGNKVILLGRVGKDEFGSSLIANQKLIGVVTDHIIQDESTATGTAMITVDEQGNNSIVISAGANGKVTPKDIEKVTGLIKTAKILILQLEIPLDAVSKAVETAHRFSVPVVLNPSPVLDLPKEMWPLIDHLILNETEASSISGIDVQDLPSTQEAAKEILDLGVKNVIITLGANGSYLMNGNFGKHIPTLKVDVVDTTAAGDAFIGGFVTGLMNCFSLPQSALYGSCSGAVSVSRHGAQSSLPDVVAVNGIYRLLSMDT
jgi:ribokinase